MSVSKKPKDPRSNVPGRGPRYSNGSGPGMRFRIETNPEVCGGEACLVRTRVPVWLLVQARKLGATDAELLKSYPTLRAEDLANAWAYYRSHQEEIDNQIRENEEA